MVKEEGEKEEEKVAEMVEKKEEKTEEQGAEEEEVETGTEEVLHNTNRSAENICKDLDC